MVFFMFDIRNKIADHKTACKVAAASTLPAVVASVTSVTAFAADGVDTTSIRTTMTSSFTTIGSDILGFFGDILPIALPILGAALVISVGIAIFKKVTKKAASG